MAVLPVMFFHAGVHFFSGGFVGVDVFFVISGYLITSILMAEHQAGEFTILKFYERRARRILPALFVVLIACLPFAWAWLIPSDFKTFSQSLISVSLFSSNIFFWLKSNYFSPDAELNPLLHTWSLSVEEQYYVFFPILLALTWRLGRYWTVIILALLAVASLVAAQWLSMAGPQAAFYLLPSRGWELLIGALTACHLNSRKAPTSSRWLNELGGGVGLALLAYATFCFTHLTPFPSVYALVPTIGAAMIIVFARPDTVAGRILGSRVLVGIGLISYSAYLWHQPLFAFARLRSLEEPGLPLMMSLLLAALGLAYLSWRFVETPFRSRQRFTRGQIFALGATGSAFFIGLGLAGSVTKGFPSRVPSALSMPGIEMARIDSGWCFYSVDSIRSLSIGAKGLDCWLGDKTSNKKGLLFGDSFAGQYEPFWQTVGSKAKVAVHVVTTNWCFPSGGDEFTGPRSSRALQQCLFNRKYLLENFQKYDFVVLGGDWGGVLQQGKMDAAIDLIRHIAAKGKLVVLMPTPKHFDVDAMFLYRRSLMFQTDFDIHRLSSQKDIKSREANGMIEKVARGMDNMVYLDRGSLFTTNGVSADLTQDQIPFTLDGRHISVYGAKAAAEAFLKTPSYQALLSQLH